MEFQDVKIEIFVPREYVEKIRDGLHEIGACKVGEYDHVISFGKAEGYWRPLETSHPFKGKIGEINHGIECKMEIRCPIQVINEAVRVIKRIHPYEEPVINIVPLLNYLLDNC